MSRAVGWRTPLPLAAWPEIDRVRWGRAYQERDELFPTVAGVRRWNATTWTMVEKGYGEWLRHLDHEGKLDGAADPGGRITPAAVRAYLEALRPGRLDATVVIAIDCLAAAAPIVAPDRDWSWLRHVAQHLRGGMTNRKEKQPRIVPIGRLYQLGFELMAKAPSIRGVQRAAVRFRDGLLTAMLAANPVRRANLAGLRLGVSLVEFGDNWWFDIGADETKNGESIDPPLPEELTEPLRRYLDRHRSILLGRGVSDRLWITKDGTWLRPHAVRTQITRLTRARLGVAVNPHLFRHCAATSIAIEDPKHVMIIKSVLAHRSLATGEKYYNLAGSNDANRRHQGVLRRAGDRPEPRRRRRQG